MACAQRHNGAKPSGSLRIPAADTVLESCAKHPARRGAWRRVRTDLRSRVTNYPPKVNVRDRPRRLRRTREHARPSAPQNAPLDTRIEMTSIRSGTWGHDALTPTQSEGCRA